MSTHSVYNIPPDGVAQMLQARKDLQTTILKYETMVEELERLWETKVCFVVSVPKSSCNGLQ